MGLIRPAVMTPLPGEHLQPGHFTSQTLCNTSSCKRASQASVHIAQRRTLCNTNIWHHSAITVGESSLRPTLTTLETNSYNSYNTLPSAHFLSQGKVSHTCTNVQHGWALLMLAIDKIDRIEKAIHLESTTEQLNNHWFALNLSSLRCLSVYPVRLLCDRKNT